jgi:hypothetical protein
VQQRDGAPSGGVSGYLHGGAQGEVRTANDEGISKESNGGGQSLV